MAKADLIYNELCQDILDNGEWDTDATPRTKWADGSIAYSKSVFGRQLKFSPETLPLITSKFVATKTAIKEILWIWQQKSNSVEDLKKQNVNIWNEWVDEEGTIGKAYGWQMANKRHLLSDKTVVDQTDYVLNQLKYNPKNRRILTTLYDIDDLSEMQLEPCVWSTQWYVVNGKVNLIVNQRSADVFLGLPFNIFQYGVLMRFIAKSLGLNIGELTWNIGVAHIYDRHIDLIKGQIKAKTYPQPDYFIPTKDDFYEFDFKDFILFGYEHGESIKTEVAI